MKWNEGGENVKWSKINLSESEVKWMITWSESEMKENENRKEVKWKWGEVKWNYLLASQMVIYRTYFFS